MTKVIFEVFNKFFVYNLLKENKMSISGDIIKNLRVENNLTQTELSQAVGISQSIIARWEKGERVPTLDNLITLSKYFGCTIDYLAGLEQD